MAHPLMSDSVWYNQQKYEASEALYQQNLAGTTSATTTTNQAKQTGASSIINELAQARQQIQKVLTSHNGGYCGGSGADSQVLQRVESLEKENKALKQVLDDMKAVIQRLEGRVSSLEGNKAPASAKPAPAPAKADDDDDDDDDVDLFGSDEEDDAEAEKLKEERVKLYYEKKAKKPAVIAKSNIILDVKPWDDETDMKELEKAVRSVTCDGLVWGASKLVPVGYGIKKLQITCVVEDEKVSTDFLDEEITAHEDFVQSVDIVAFNKI